MYKTSATRKQMMRGLSKKIVDRAVSLSVVKKFNNKILAKPLEFEVGDHTVTVKIQGNTKDPEFFLNCTCNFFRYSGPEYHAQKEGYLLGKPRGSAEFPKEKDPDGINKVCKHCVAVIREYF